MALDIKRVGGTSLQVENATGHWVIFTLDELRSHSALLSAGSVEGTPALPEKDAELFVWSAFAAARGYAVEHGLIAGG
ncbi:hypothetical protein [Lichenibacterium dinghuense]|uniref:hypothetical protein n=1 Tax=Lichenibacterium dinghuense TaxID=2895977 RepID=UPI001F3148EA|nr:hypothetical protein [Lichenibacterium sp. 6Y81]